MTIPAGRRCATALLVLGLVLALGLTLPSLAGAVDPETIGLFRPDSPTGNNTYFLRNKNTLAPPANTIAGFGNTGDKPVVADWNNEGIRKIGVFRPNTPAGSNTLFLRSVNRLGVGDLVINSLGVNGDILLTADWDGNGTETPGLFRPNTPSGSNTLFIWNNNNDPPGPPDITLTGIGAVGDKPLAGKWTGNGGASIGLFRSNSPAGSNTFFIWSVLPLTPPFIPDITVAGIGAAPDDTAGSPGTGTETPRRGSVSFDRTSLRVRTPSSCGTATTRRRRLSRTSRSSASGWPGWIFRWWAGGGTTRR